MPPTPPGNENANTKFGNAARGLARELESHVTAMAQSTVRERKSAKNTKVPLKSVVNELQEQRPIHAPAPRNVGSRTPYRNGKLYLPDLTGITSAVGSPMKLGLEYKVYDGRDDREIDGGCSDIVHYREVDIISVRLATTLNIVQSKLAHLEKENSVSRRRVRELELELEECKKEVARERTKVLERGESDTGAPQEKVARGVRTKVPKPAEALDTDEDIRRYKEAVEEKKGLNSVLKAFRTC